MSLCSSAEISACQGTGEYRWQVQHPHEAILATSLLGGRVHPFCSSRRGGSAPAVRSHSPLPGVRLGAALGWSPAQHGEGSGPRKGATSGLCLTPAPPAARTRSKRRRFESARINQKQGKACPACLGQVFAPTAPRGRLRLRPGRSVGDRSASIGDRASDEEVDSASHSVHDAHEFHSSVPARERILRTVRHSRGVGGDVGETAPAIAFVSVPQLGRPTSTDICCLLVLIIHSVAPSLPVPLSRFEGPLHVGVCALGPREHLTV